MVSPIISNLTPLYRFDSADILSFLTFKQDLVSAQGWSTAWAQVAKKFFLYGTSIEFNPEANELDRIVNYMIALESALVPEKDFVGARLRERGSALLKSYPVTGSDDESADSKEILKRLYDVRSTIAHGGVIGDEERLF